MFPAALGSRVYAASNKDEYQEIFLWNGAQCELKAFNLTAIWEPTVQAMEFSAAHSPIGLHGLLRGKLYLLL
jgi:hypothetical protein